MDIIVACVVISALTAKIVATYYFKKVDGYVKEMCEKTIENNKQTLAILHKLKKSSSQEE